MNSQHKYSGLVKRIRSFFVMFINVVISNNGFVVIMMMLLAAVFFISHHMCESLTEENNRLEMNESILMAQIDTFRNRNGELTAKVAELEIKERDFEKFMADDARLINELKRKNEKLEHLVKTEVETVVEFKTVVKDSLIYVDTLKSIKWDDEPWVSFHAQIAQDGTIAATIKQYDEIDVAVMLEYKRFLWWNTRVKGANVQVVSRNPYTTRLNVHSVKLLNK